MYYPPPSIRLACLSGAVRLNQTPGDRTGADRLALWGGIECTVNRVGDVFRDQTRLTGHHDRPDDLAAFAAIGIRKLRYPVLWERVAPDRPDQRDWRWSDERLAEIARLGMHPIVGLLHHGSGPSYTSLVADDFPRLFAAHAGAVAQRYPEIVDWTPVNEPLTTARFSALYGHWYPHRRDERSFWLALLNQIDATRLAMRAIRRVNPGAQLIQTEDLGETYATGELAGVARHYNDRRWLTWDLLCGRVVPGHAMWEHGSAEGFAGRLRAIADDPCPPDVIGVNHYVTSDRYLDRDPACGPLPGAGFHDHAAARLLDPAAAGLPGLLTQLHARYGRPIAMTECHLGCTRDEQMRWLLECWQACRAARQGGIDVIALTAWALTGSVDWDSLLTEARGRHEAGPFEVAGTRLRPTAQATLLRQLQAGDDPTHGSAHHPVLATPGWWRRGTRLGPDPALPIAPDGPPAGRPLLIIGASGTLGRAFAGGCTLRGIAHVITDRATLPIDDPARIAAVVDQLDPWAVINAAGWVRIDEAEAESALCHAANCSGAINVARACDARAVPYMVFSSDQVFDGAAPAGYDEDAAPRPLNVYGASKRGAELGCLAFARSIVVRTAAFFSPYDPHNFAMQVEQALRDGRPFSASHRHVVTPTYVPHLVNACLDLLIDAESGLWHLSSGERLSWFDFGTRIAHRLGLDVRLLRPADAPELGWIAARPRHAGLRSVRGRMLPDLAAALDHHHSVRCLPDRGNLLNPGLRLPVSMQPIPAASHY